MISKSTLFLAVLVGSAVCSSAFAQSNDSASQSAPAGDATTVAPVLVDASSPKAPVFISFKDGVLSSSADNTGWQISAVRTQFQTNSGTSGTGHVAIASADVVDFDAVTECSAKAWTVDETLPASGAPGSLPYSGNAILNAWYDYDMDTHIVTSKQLVYLVQDEGSCYKFQIVSWNDGKYEMKAQALKAPVAAPAVTQQILKAASAAAPVYFALEGDQLVPSTADANWLLAVKRTQWQTNSGTSGTGAVGVYDSGSTDFAALTSCAGLSFTADETLPASGAPGSLPYSGNAVLNAWYNYDMDTHIVTSKQNVYAISSGEQCIKFQILSWGDGNYSVQYSEVK